MNEEQSYQTINPYDRLRERWRGVALFTKPSTVKEVQPVTGVTETFVIETARHRELGDFVFLECITSEEKVIRLVLPPRVGDTIVSHKASLTARSRSNASKAAMKNRMAAGYVPKPPRRRKGGAA